MIHRLKTTCSKISKLPHFHEAMYHDLLAISFSVPQSRNVLQEPRNAGLYVMEFSLDGGLTMQKSRGLKSPFYSLKTATKMNY